MTQYLTFSQNHLTVAKKIICDGGVVAFPTETVYGLGANAFDVGGVQKIFEAKGRPSDNPLIVHVWNSQQIYQVAKNISDDAKKIIDGILPESLTIVLQKKPVIHDIVTAGLDTVAVRMPKSIEAQQFLKAVNLPIAAPSANVSTKISPTSWQAVSQQLDGKIDAILMGSNCQVGIESTVLDLSTDIPKILRPGIVTPSQISQILGKEVEIHSGGDQKVNSPGMKYKHYSPDCPVVLNTDGNTKKINSFFDQLTKEGKNPVLLTTQKQGFDKPNSVFLGETADQAAKNIYAMLDYCQKNFQFIIVVFTHKGEVADSVLNRLIKASGGNIL